MHEIHFFYEDTDFTISKEATLQDWIHHCIQNEGYELTSINYIFCSDEYLRQVNIDYLDHDYYTDIITFDNSEEEKHVESDIFISIDRVRENAQQQDTAFETELKRVLIHGVLHLVGYNDKTESQKMEMREKENAYLSLPQFQI
ncbi:rRNA maturation RNase YbeY [Reichenbachiella sp. 5M10]|uniref:rRNA maturation RNase YbeY n=1 Tax=Reichenbachiella sp. 5M10 TaxID=1889772 RepID=UPI000C150134|nr:rRNA maturation RNase YbeY [Reichenbachiella sp. 5M10]PIB37009.1 rRNA maturation RNase YbeY [Reichenbachiella sp. 5M10]